MNANEHDEPFRFDGMAREDVQATLEAIATWDDSLYELTRTGAVEVAFTSDGDGSPAHADFPSCPRPGKPALDAIAALVSKARPKGHVWDDCDGRGRRKYPEGMTLTIPGIANSATFRAAADTVRRNRLEACGATVAKLMDRA